MIGFAPTAFAALLIEGAAGYPDMLYRAIRHPVVWIGGLISIVDSSLNRSDFSSTVRRAAGILALLLLIAIPGVIACALHLALAQFRFGWLAEAALASTLLAQRSLYTHVAAVAAALETGGLTVGRKAVSMIVGRNPETLDEAGVSRAAIESLAENFSDGVVAPLFWLLVGGLPGIAIYKAINTADSMIGHRTPRHLAFGWAAARCDDLVNLPASRLTALFLLLASGRFAGAGHVLRDAPRHRSPNAGWPEAAMAHALDLRLAGPRIYGDVAVKDHWMGDGRAAATAADIRAALQLYRRALALIWVTVAVLAALSYF